MANTHDYSIANDTGSAVRTDLNTLFTEVEATNAGATAPSNLATGKLWYDTANSLLKQYDGSAWVVIQSGATPDIGTPSAGVVTNLSGVLPVGVTGGSGLDAVSPANLASGVLPVGVSGGSGLTALGTVTAGTLSHGTALQGWVDTSNTGVTFPVGHILQTKSYHTASVLTVSCVANTHTDLPTFVIAITPSSESSKILVMLNIGGFNFSSTNYEVSGGGQLRRKIASGSFAGIGIGTANAIWNASFVLPQNTSYTYNSVHAIYLDSPNTLSECTYGIAVNDHNDGTETFYLNQLGATNQPYAQAYASSIIVQEIAG
jgi:hypothetical protein